jgi:hypothetical protein
MTPPNGARRNGDIEANVDTPTHNDEWLSLYTTHAFPSSNVHRATLEHAVPPQSARKSGYRVAGSRRSSEENAMAGDYTGL